MEVKTINKTQEAIRKISPELKQFISELFDQSIVETIRDGALPKKSSKYMTPDVLSVAKHHKNVLDSADYSILSKTDQRIFNLYRAGLDNIISQRKVVALMKVFLRRFVDFIMWATISWNYNHSEEEISADIVANLKGLTPQLAKSLLKNVNLVLGNDSLCILQPVIIRDLFRGSFVTAQEDVDNLKSFINYVVAILTNPISAEYKEFYTWVVQESNKFFGRMRIPKEELLEFQKYSFWFDHEKNYIDSPKGEYRAWQVTIIISDTPDYDADLRGKMFEFKFCTFDMYETALIGEASQDEYKRDVYEFIEEVFSLANYSGGLEFFARGLDKNGLTQARDFYSRNVNSNVIPITSE